MSDRSWPIDRFLGYGGFVTAAVVLVLHITASANPDVDWLSVLGEYVAPIVALAWLVAVTARHVRGHPHESGRTAVLTAWILVALFYAFAVLQALDPANEASVLDKLPTLGELVSTAGLMVPIPLVIASAGLIREAPDRPSGGLISPTLL